MFDLFYNIHDKYVIKDNEISYIIFFIHNIYLKK
jgi:hypothetical protein